jgi:uncharacterized protein YqeY
MVWESAMETKLKLESDLKDALRAGDNLRKNTLRLALSAIRLAEIDRGSKLDESAVIAILQKEIKARNESIEDAQRAGRPELEEAAREEIKVLQVYLPQAMSPEELEAQAKQSIAEVGATSLREMGQVMKVLLPRLAGRATGDQASQVVRKLLQ